MTGKIRRKYASYDCSTSICIFQVIESFLSILFLIFYSVFPIFCFICRFSPGDTNLVLREFEKCGVVLKHIAGPRDANWMHILYQVLFSPIIIIPPSLII